jgi:hydrogenase maturation protease
MNFDAVEKLANAVLYEGYMLYPYRASSVKNQKRFNFGVLAPPGYGAEASEMQTECLVRGDTGASLAVKVRFLQPERVESWMDVYERTVGPVEQRLINPPRREEFDFPPARGTVEVSVQALAGQLYRVTVRIANLSPMERPPQSREDILPQSFCSTHTLLGVDGGEFISLLEPPSEFADAAAGCTNVGTWPILAGQPGERGVMLSSPIILYDYAQVAPESPGDLFDGAEIDEILSLRILTLTDEEKREMREGDERGRRILERTESLPPEHFMKLHGALRGLRTLPEEPR